jgi:hypothetical protein
MFTVRWKRSALNELADLWVKADSAVRQSITAASQGIDQQLKDDPENQGESRSGDLRIFFLAPLGITYEVDNQTSTVYVLHVWLFRGHTT